MKIGRLLLSSLRKKTRSAASRRTDRKSSGTSFGFKLSKADRKLKKKSLEASKKKSAAKQGTKKAIEPVAAKPVSQQAAESLPLVVAPVAPVTVSTQVAQVAPSALSTQLLIHPDEKLKSSVEAFLLDQRSPHTRRAYGKDLRRFLQFLAARKREKGSEPIDRALIVAYKDSLLSQALEHTTVDRHLATLRSFFRFLGDDGFLVKNPAEGVRFLNPKRVSRTQGFSDADVVQVLKQPDLHSRTGSLHYSVLMVLFYCGLRRSEVCELRTTNIGFERGNRVLRLRGKGNAERLIVIPEPVWRGIEHYFYIAGRVFAVDDFLFRPIRNNRTGVKEKPLDPSMIFYIVAKYAKSAGVAQRVSPHSCRATAISNARDHHVPDRAIQEFAGWASPDMITRYDKRKASIENSASKAIRYGTEADRLARDTQPKPTYEKRSEKAEGEIEV